MARDFTPAFPFDVAMKLLIPTSTIVKGVTSKTYPDPSTIDDVIYVGFRTFGGTENLSNEVYTIFNTAVIDTWYDPRIKSDCQLYDCETGGIYHIISPPEDIGRRHQFLQFKVEKVGGKP